MPVSVVTNETEEHKWERAKQIAKEEGHEKDWKYIMGIYKRMNPHRFKEAASAAANNAANQALVIKDPLAGKIDPLAVTYKNINDAGIKGLISTTFAGMGARLGAYRGRKLLGSLLSKLKSNLPNDTSFLNRLGTFGENISKPYSEGGNNKSKLAIDGLMALGGGLIGNSLGNKLFTPLYLNGIEGINGKTSWNNVGDTYKKLFKGLPRSYQEKKLDEYKDYVASAYGLNMTSNLLNKGLNLAGGIVAAEAAQKALKGTPFGYAPWDKKKGFIGNVNRMILPAITDALATAGGIGAANLLTKKFTHNVNPLPPAYYTDPKNLKDVRTRDRIGRAIGRVSNDYILNSLFPGRELSSPATERIPVYTTGENKGKTMSIYDANMMRDAELTAKREFYNKHIGKYVNPLESFLQNTIGKGVDTASSYADKITDIPVEMAGLGNGKLD